MNGDRAGNKAIARLLTNLFLYLSLGSELDLLVDEQGKVDAHGQFSRYRLAGWTRIDDQSAELKLRKAVQESPNPHRPLTVDITGDIIGKLRSQGHLLSRLFKFQTKAKEVDSAKRRRA